MHLAALSWALAAFAIISSATRSLHTENYSDEYSSAHSTYLSHASPEPHFEDIIATSSRYKLDTHQSYQVHRTLKNEVPTPVAVVIPRSQTTAHDESIACDYKSIRYGKTVVCAPASNAAGNLMDDVCGTILSATTGCNLSPSDTTQTLTASTMMLRCDQDTCDRTGCGYIAPDIDTADSCNSCFTVDGKVHAPQSTSVLETVTPSTYLVNQLGTQFRDGIFNEAKQSLLDRSFVDPSLYSNYDSFMVSGVKQAKSNDALLIGRPSGTGGRSNAMFKGLGSYPLTLAVTQLRACTAIIVISRRGVWLSHHWEVPTFNNKQGGNHVDEDILVGMFTGDDSGWYPGLNQFSGDGQAFSNQTSEDIKNVIKIIIITPHANGTFWSGAYAPENGFPLYEERPFLYFPNIWDIQNALQTVYHVRPEVHTYIPIDGSQEVMDEVHKNTARGKVLIQYDPIEVVVPAVEKDQTATDGTICGRPTAAIRVWVEDNGPIYQDSWPAMLNQIPAKKNQRVDTSKETMEERLPLVCVPNRNATTTTFATTQPVAYKSRRTKKSSISKQKRATMECTDALCVLESALKIPTVAKSSQPASKTTQPTSRRIHTSATKTSLPQSLPPLTSCSLSSLTGRTYTSSGTHTVTPQLVCNCNKATEVSLEVETRAGGDGKITSYCVGYSSRSFLLGSTKAPIPVTENPASCIIKTDDATMGSGSTITPSVYCRCGTAMVRMDTSTGTDGRKTLSCALGTSIDRPFITPAPTPTPSTDSIPKALTCSLYFNEAYDHDHNVVTLSYKFVEPGGQALSGWHNITKSTQKELYIRADVTGLSYDIVGNFAGNDAELSANNQILDSTHELTWHKAFPGDPWCHRSEMKDDARQSVCRWDCGLPVPVNAREPFYNGWCNIKINESIPALSKPLPDFHADGRDFPVHLSVEVTDSSGHVGTGPWTGSANWTDTFLVPMSWTHLPYDIRIYADGRPQLPGSGHHQRRQNGVDSPFEHNDSGEPNGIGWWWDYEIQYYKKCELLILFGASSRNSASLYAVYSDNTNPQSFEYDDVDQATCDDADKDWKDCADPGRCIAYRVVHCHWRC